MVLDAFLGDSSPSHLMSREAFTAMRRCLKPGGTLVINSFGELDAFNFFFTGSLDKTLKSVNQTSYKLWNDTRLRKNNTSGVAGVARYAPLVQVGARWVARPFWQAYWVDAEANKKSRKFSVDKYGEASAKRRAIMARRMAISERRGQKRLSKTG